MPLCRRHIIHRRTERFRFNEKRVKRWRQFGIEHIKQHDKRQPPTIVVRQRELVRHDRENTPTEATVHDGAAAFPRVTIRVKSHLVGVVAQDFHFEGFELIVFRFSKMFDLKKVFDTDVFYEKFLCVVAGFGSVRHIVSCCLKENNFILNNHKHLINSTLKLPISWQLRWHYQYLRVRVTILLRGFSNLERSEKKMERKNVKNEE